MAKIISDKILTSRQFAEAYSGNYYTCCDTWSEVRNCLRSEQIYIGPGLPLSQIPYEFAKVPDENQYVIVQFSTEESYTEYEYKLMRIQKKYEKRFAKNLEEMFKPVFEY